jgi:hypothetical protein
MSANTTQQLEAQLRAARGLPSPKAPSTPKPRASRAKAADGDGSALRLISPPPPAVDLITTAQVAERAGVSEFVVLYALAHGHLPAVQRPMSKGPGASNLFNVADVDAWIASRTKPTPEQLRERQREHDRAYKARQRAERDARRGPVSDPCDPDLVSITAAAEEVGLTRCALTNAITAGELVVAKRGKLGAHLLSLSAVRAWLAERAEIMAERGRYWRQSYQCIDGCGTEVRSHAGRCPVCRQKARVERMRQRREAAREAYLQGGGDPKRLRPGARAGAARSPRPPRTPNAVAPIVAPRVSPRPVRVQPAPPPAQTIARDAAIEEGMAAWSAGRFSAQIAGTGCTIPDPRGFWLVSGPEGFRPERVGATLAAGERAIEQHWRDGFGGWQSRTIETKGKP